jgi:hypothetical protein
VAVALRPNLHLELVQVPRGREGERAALTGAATWASAWSDGRSERRGGGDSEERVWARWRSGKEGAPQQVMHFCCDFRRDSTVVL